MIISAIRTVLLYLIILTAVRMMGKRQISEMQTSELVITLLMSNIASIPMQDTEQSLLSGVLPIMVLLVCEIMLSYLMLKRAKIRKLVCGKPVIVIDHGVIDQQALKQLRISTEDLMEQLRQKDVFDPKEAAFAIVETNGMLSVLKDPQEDTVKAKDLSIRTTEPELAVTVVSDGEIAPSSLRYCGMDRSGLLKILKRENTALSDVFLMTCDRSGQYRLIRKES